MPFPDQGSADDPLCGLTASWQSAQFSSFSELCDEIFKRVL
jgi:hypothetical protein